MMMIAPDYQGLGKGDGYHPYLIKSQTVRSSIDMLLAARKFVKEKYGIELRADIVVAGYSQGAHAAMALQHAVESGADIGGMRIVFSAAYSGPMNLSSILLDAVIRRPVDSRMSYFAMLILAHFQQFYGDVYQSPAEVFRAPYIRAIPVALDFDVEAVKKIVPETPRQMLTPHFYNSLLEDEEHPLRYRLRQNDIKPWKARSKIYLGYSAGDKTVSPRDTIKFYQDMKKAGSPIQLRRTSDRFDHGLNFVRSMKDLRKIIDAWQMR